MHISTTNNKEYVVDNPTNNTYSEIYYSAGDKINYYFYITDTNGTKYNFRVSEYAVPDGSST
jgi:hypothetical protein